LIVYDISHSRRLALHDALLDYGTSVQHSILLALGRSEDGGLRDVQKMLQVSPHGG
jgi:hypothetical protein